MSLLDPQPWEEQFENRAYEKGVVDVRKDLMQLALPYMRELRAALQDELETRAKLIEQAL